MIDIEWGAQYISADGESRFRMEGFLYGMPSMDGIPTPYARAALVIKLWTHAQHDVKYGVVYKTPIGAYSKFVGRELYTVFKDGAFPKRFCANSLHICVDYGAYGPTSGYYVCNDIADVLPEHAPAVSLLHAAGADVDGVGMYYMLCGDEYYTLNKLFLEGTA